MTSCGSRGTAASPAAVLHGDSLGVVSWRGYGATGYGSGAARVNAIVYEPVRGQWNDAAQGTQILIQTNPPGLISPFDQCTIGPGLTVGAPTPPSGGMQIGDLNASRILLNGVVVTAGTGGGGGPVTLTGDVTGGPATTTINATVVRLQGFNLAPTTPLSGQVLGWDGTQWLPVAAVTGSGGPPGGTIGQVQINNGGAFGGITLSGDATMTAAGVVTLANTAGARADIGLGTASVPTFTGATLAAAGAGLVINRNTAAMPPALGNSSLWVNWGDSGTDANPNFVLDTHGNSATLAFRSTGGTGGTATATPPTTVLGSIAWRGYTGAAYASNPTASISVASRETFSSGAQGSQMIPHHGLRLAQPDRSVDDWFWADGRPWACDTANRPGCGVSTRIASLSRRAVGGGRRRNSRRP
jgi:hypothetical protein